MASASPTIDPTLQSLGGALDPTGSPSDGVGGQGHGGGGSDADEDGGVTGDMTANEITAVLEMAAAANASAGSESLQQTEKAKTDGPAKLAKAKVHQCAALREAAEKALAGIWAILDSAESPGQSIQVSRALDRTFGQLHGAPFPPRSQLADADFAPPALSTTYKPDYKALIWIADIPLKSIRENYRAGPGPAYFAVKKTNMAFVAEYMLYAMPNEAGFGKNDLVFACEGLLPLVPPMDLLEQEETWKLFNELKIQIYIQRLQTLGREEADQRVLPNLFVETLSSYAGQAFSDHLQQRFDDLGKQSRAEVRPLCRLLVHPIESGRHRLSSRMETSRA